MLNICDIAHADPHLSARRMRDRAAMAATMAYARQSVLAGRTAAGWRGGLIGLAVAVATWPFAHTKRS